MSFAQSLERMHTAAQQRARGRADGITEVRISDLRELLQQFHRLDEEARARHRANSEMYPPGTERST